MITKAVKALLAVGVTTALALSATLASAATTTIPLSGNRVSFNNTVKIGQSAIPGFTTRYANAVTIGGQTVDAILTLKSITPSSLVVNNIDRVSSVAGYDLWTNLQIPSGGGEAVYTVSFVLTGTNDPVALQGVAINVGDIDANQYVQFSGVQSYTLTTGTQLTVKTSTSTPPVTVGSVPDGSYRFWEANNVGTVETDQNYWAQVNYSQPISSVDVVLGATRGGAALYQVSFAAAGWGSAPTAVTNITPSIANYTVSYSGNGSTGGTVPTATTAAGGTAQNIAAGVPTKPSATFDGWNTRPDGSGVSYAVGDTIIPTTDVTLYAVWLQQITVTYDGNGANIGVPPSPVTATGMQTIAAPGALARDGYSFAGWNTLANGTGVPYQPGEQFQPTANGILWAQWTPNPVVPPNSPIDIPIVPGDVVGGSEVPYVVPGLDPGTNWTVDVVPNGGGSATELDAGTVPDSGTVIGETTLPNLGPGSYELTFNGTNADGTTTTISKEFTVAANGTLVSKQADATRKNSVLAATGANVDAGAIALSMLIAGAAALLLTRRRRA